MNSRTGIFADSLHKICLFVSLPFYLTSDCTCGEPEKSPPPSARLVFSPSVVARIGFSDTPHPTPNPKTLAPFSPPAPTGGSLPVLLPRLCHPPRHPPHWCGVNPNSAPSISAPGGAGDGAGKLSAKGRGCLSPAARDAAPWHCGQHQLPKYLKDFAEKTLLRVRKTTLRGEDPFNPMWGCSCVLKPQTGLVTFTATPARCCTLPGCCCK